jgi:hypothetical protein
VSKLRELPVRVDVDANIVEPSVRLGRELFVPGSVPSLAHLLGLSRLSETVHKLSSTPALDIVRMERFSINTISSLRLPSSTDLDAIKPARLQKQIDELLKTSEVPEQLHTPEVVVATPALPRMRDLPIRGDVDATRHVGPQIPETVLEEIKSTIPTTPKTIELPRMRDLPIRGDVDATKYMAGEAPRPALQIPTVKMLSQPRELEGVVARLSASPPVVPEVGLPRLGESHVRAVEAIALGSEGIPALASLPKLPQMGLPSTPALEIVRMERFSINTISSLGLSREAETVLEPIEARPATVELPKLRDLPIRADVDAKGSAMPEIPSLGQQLVSEGVTLPRLKPGELAVTSPKLGQLDVLKQLSATEVGHGVELLKPLPSLRLLQPMRATQASELELRTPGRLDLDVKTVEALELNVKQILPPELAEPGVPALPPAGRTLARAGRLRPQELRLPSLSSELRKLRLARWEWELPEWGKGLRKLLTGAQPTISLARTQHIHGDARSLHR